MVARLSAVVARLRNTVSNTSIKSDELAYWPTTTHHHPYMVSTKMLQYHRLWQALGADGENMSIEEANRSLETMHWEG